MDIVKTIDPALFEQFQTENMDSALAVIDINLTKFEKRKQVAARLLGFDSYEAMTSSSKFTEQTTTSKMTLADQDELIVQRHPTIKNLICFTTDRSHFEFDVIKGSWRSYINEDDYIPSLPVSELYEEDTYDIRPPQWVPKSFDLGFDGVKKYNVSATRQGKLMLRFDWLMENGLVVPFCVDIKKYYVEKPTARKVVTKMEMNVYVDLEVYRPGTNRLDHSVTNTEKQTNPSLNVNRDMIIWEMIQNTPAEWSLNSLSPRDIECVEVAYQFLDAQKKCVLKKQSHYALKGMVERWSRRYISRLDVEMAIRLHPELRGNASSCNISSNFVMPSMNRLSRVENVPIDLSYRFVKDGSDLDCFKKMEIDVRQEVKLVRFSQDDYFKEHEFAL